MNEFDEKFERLLRCLGDALDVVVKSESIKTPQQAVRVKSLITRNLGILNAKHKLPHNRGVSVRASNSR